MTDEGVLTVAKGCPLLKEFYIEKGSKVTEEGAAAVRAALPECEVLYG